jgi:transposase, IS30 family
VLRVADHTMARLKARRPTPFIPAENEALCWLIAVWMNERWSPKLISRLEFYLP